MEHPYLFFVKFFETLGFGEFAHNNPHVVYSWVVMAIIIVLGGLSVKGVAIIPGKGQNVLELVVSGIEDFMVDTIGEEGRCFSHWQRLFFFTFLSVILSVSYPDFIHRRRT